MNATIRSLLDNQYGNYIMPFFWQHGEDEKVLREYMGVIHDCGIGAVCVESRPHPDFCGEKWWKDMDVILDEAKKRGMKVWILDDSHFPTGFANGAMADMPEELCRQGICYESRMVKGGRKVSVNIEKFLKKKNRKFSVFELGGGSRMEKRVFSPDIVLSITAVKTDGNIQNFETIDLTFLVQNGRLIWNAPEGNWKIGLCKLSRNCGAHPNYINMMDPASCRILLDTVYEPHYSHYKEEFGKTIAGFFSDEPELGNGKMYSNEKLGTGQDLPWCHTLAPELEKALGIDWKNYMPYLWETDLNPIRTAQVRYAYMDAVTRGVRQAFSEQIGGWCRKHGVEYIGHVVEDNNAHARTGSSLGHYFRGLAGQDMAGIDDIGGQVMPQGEDGPDRFMRFQKRDGEFYHYILGRLGPSLAAIDSKKYGRTMCEIFGNYGWAEGLRLERYLADHFMVNGVNRFVPHAFSAKDFPDSDCPPHFYAHGHNPQYRHFGSLMGYMNRICELISGGNHIAPVAVLYHGEAEWTGEAMLMQKPARKLLDAQINFDILPTDVFSNMEYYHTCLESEFRVNTQIYRALVIPYAQFVSKSFVQTVEKLLCINVPAIFVDGLPEGFYDGSGNMDSVKARCLTVPLQRLADVLKEKDVAEITLAPADSRIRYLHYRKETDIYYFINEGTESYKGVIGFPQTGPTYAYHAWDNVLEQVEEIKEKDVQGSKSFIKVELEPFQSLIVLFDEAEEGLLRQPLMITEKSGNEVAFMDDWKRSVCESVAYPDFGQKKTVQFPDCVAEEMPKFSGWVRYENRVHLHDAARTILTITDAYEGVEVFINSISAGVQVVPPYRFDISDFVMEGENMVVIEVSTTLERERIAAKNRTMAEKLMQNKVPAPTGITGEVKVYEET